MNAVLGRLTAQSLIETRNAQAAIAMQTALIELLALDGKRQRDAQADTLNQQLNALQDEDGIAGSLLDGSGQTLRNYRLP